MLPPSKLQKTAVSESAAKFFIPKSLSSVLVSATTCIANTPTSYRSLSGPSGPKCPGKCPRECPRKRGCQRECLQGPSGPGLQSVQKFKCPKSVPGVVKKESRTLWGHSRDSFWTLQSPGPEGPRTLRARRARETPVAGRCKINSRTFLCL